MDVLNALSPLPPSLSNAYDPEGFRSFGHEMVDMLADHLAHCQNRGAKSSYPGHSPAEEMAFWKATIHGDGASEQGAVLEDMLQRSNQLHDPRYMGHQVAVPFSPRSLGWGNDRLDEQWTGHLRNGAKQRRT